MSVDIEGLVGTTNMQLSARPQVIATLQKLPISATEKRYLFARWLRLLGYHPEPADLDMVAPWSQL